MPWQVQETGETVLASWSGEMEEVRRCFVDLFQIKQGEYEDVLRHVQARIFQEDSEMLKPVEIEEFKQALFQMHSDKALGPDGLNQLSLSGFSTYVGWSYLIRRNLG